MGQKTNPISNRIGITRGWDSNWCGGNYAEKIAEDYEIRKYLTSRLSKASISKIVIERTLKLITVTIHAARPGFIIGKGGQEVDKLKEELKKVFGISSPTASPVRSRAASPTGVPSRWRSLRPCAWVPRASRSRSAAASAVLKWPAAKCSRKDVLRSIPSAPTSTTRLPSRARRSVPWASRCGSATVSVMASRT